jgi:RNA polymerase sigma-70 factor (ECF subfamily)
VEGQALELAETSFEARILALHDPAFRLAFGMLHDHAEVEDVLQEAAFHAWRRRGDLRDPDALRAWFLRIVANQCRMVRRTRWWSVLRIHVTSVLPDPIAIDESVVVAADVRAAVASLPTEQRLVVMLRYFLDLPFEEVASIAGISVVAARARASRAVKQLERQLHLPEWRES